jgi:hypothetical protein
MDLALLLRSTALVPADHVLHNNLCSDMLAVAEHMLRGELQYRLGTSCSCLQRYVHHAHVLPILHRCAV